MKKKKVKTAEDAINGALDIIAEVISDEASYRKWIRELTIREGKIETKGTVKNLLHMKCTMNIVKM